MYIHKHVFRPSQKTSKVLLLLVKRTLKYLIDKKFLFTIVKSSKILPLDLISN